MLQRPKTIIDISKRRGEAYWLRPQIINLHKARIFILPVRFPAAVFISVLTILYFFLSSFFFSSLLAPSSGPTLAAENEAERLALEAELKELYRQIEEDETTLARYKKQGDTLKSEISRLETNISKLSLQIKAVTLNISRLNRDINDTQSEIEVTESEIALHKEAISKLLRSIRESETQSLIEILLSNPQLSDFFGNINDILLIEDNLRVELKEIVVLRLGLVQKKELLSLQKSDAEALKAYQDTQRKAVEETKSQKNTLLKVTKGEETRYQQIVQEKKKTAAEIRKQIFRLFGGGELSFGEAYNLARTAEEATGVRAALILAILDRESKLGRNVGQCTPEEAMSPTRDLPAFNKIVADLKGRGEFVPDPLLVSCPIRAHGSYGGAIGPSQFIPSTWLLYKDSITTVTGNNPPNPWRNADAFVGTALYLRDGLGSSSCRNYASANQATLPYNTLLERCAAAQYYSGSNWHKFRFVYGDPVVEKANEFQADIDVLIAQ